MKKFLLFAISVCMGVSAYSQQGQMSVGLSFRCAPYLGDEYSLSTLGLSANFDYGISKIVRGEVALEYEKYEFYQAVSLMTNYHFLIGNEKFAVYPIVGIGASYVIDDVFRLRGNVGLGAELAITNKLSANFEIKGLLEGSAGDTWTFLPISLGLKYKF